MKVVKVVEKSPWNKPISCKKCHSKLILEENDIKLGAFGANWGGDSPTDDMRFYFVCAVCKQTNFISENSISDGVSAKARKKWQKSYYRK